jgi:hypothetical protein
MIKVNFEESIDQKNQEEKKNDELNKLQNSYYHCLAN